MLWMFMNGPWPRHKRPWILWVLLCSIRTFYPLFHTAKISSLLCFRLSTHAHTHPGTHSITPLASLPRWVREIYGEKLGSSSAVFPRGVSLLHLYARDPLDGVENKPSGAKGLAHPETLCLPPEWAEQPPLTKINSSGWSCSWSPRYLFHLC